MNITWLHSQFRQSIEKNKKYKEFCITEIIYFSNIKFFCQDASYRKPLKYVTNYQLLIKDKTINLLNCFKINYKYFKIIKNKILEISI